ncbi:MAG: hypothetical protein ABEJ65_10610 [bacterium]
MGNEPSMLDSLITDKKQQLVDQWVSRLYDHPDSRYEPEDMPKLDELCSEGLEASLALIRGQDKPRLTEFVENLYNMRGKWDLESADLLRFFWELRKSVEELLTRGGDPGRPDWQSLHEELDRCIEVGVINLVQLIADNQD